MEAARIITSHLVYRAAGTPPMHGADQGTCRTCGAPGAGLPFNTWVRDTFTDWDKLVSGEIICHACQFCMAEAEEVLTRRVGQWWPDGRVALEANPARIERWRKEKRKAATAMPTPEEIGIRSLWGGYAVPQKMRNYSHFVVGGAWHPLSKGDKARMRSLLHQSPSVAVIADSGQKHLLFRAHAGWWQFEEQAIRPDVERLEGMLAVLEPLYVAGLSKAEIETGRYDQRRIIAVGVGVWRKAEERIRTWRGTVLFALALFLLQKGEDIGA